jgi:transcriptional regulator with XRE-family HTH domain
MNGGKWLGPDAPHAQRLRTLRKVLEFETAAAFAGRLGISPSRLSNVENGAPLGKDIAFRIVQRVPGMTLDWLWLGRPDGLPLRLAQKLEPAPGTTRRGGTRS